MSQIENSVESQNPFNNVEIPNQLPTPPTTEFVQTQNNNEKINMTEIVSNQNNEKTAQIMNQFANMVTGQQLSQQPVQAQQPVFQPQQQVQQVFQQPQQPIFQPQQQPVQQTFQPQQQVFQPQQPPIQQQNRQAVYHQSNQPVGFQPNQQQYQYNNTQQNKYNIHELLWLINPKFRENNLGNECPLLICSYNADYGNLNVRFANIKQMYETHIVSQDIERLPAAVNLYAEHCVEILSSPTINNLQIIERTFKATANWQPAYTIINKQSQTISIQSIANTVKYQYTISGYQYQAFCNALQFVCFGQGWLIALLDRILTR